MEQKIAELDLGYRSALNRIKTLIKQKARTSFAPHAEGHEVGPAIATAGGAGEAQGLKAKVSELTNELITLTKAKQQAEREVEELQRRLAAVSPQ